LERLFGKGRRVVMVAVDHGAEFGPTPGLEDLPGTLERLRGADGILLNPGMIEATAGFFGRRGAPAMVARVTWTTAYCFPWKYRESHTAEVMSAQDALGAGADLIMACCLLQSGSEALDRDNVRLFTKIAGEKERAGIPLIGELYPAGADEMPERVLHERVFRGARILAELGADAIKTFYTGRRFEEVTANCPVPVLALGASKCAEGLALEKARKAIAAGARGVVFGRNVFHARCPEGFLKALGEVVHGDGG